PDARRPLSRGPGRGGGRGHRGGHPGGAPGPGHGAALHHQGARPGAGAGPGPGHPRKESGEPARRQPAPERADVYRAPDGGGRGKDYLSVAPNPPSVLVVDDAPDTCRTLSDILTDLGYRVDTAPDGPSGLEMVRRNAYDVALLDFRMPGMDGLELYRRIKELRADTGAIIVSAYTNPATRDPPPRR